MEGQPGAAALAQAAPGTVYTCPMHPEIRQDHPGSCPKCGMTLAPLVPGSERDENREFDDFSRRFWRTLPLTLAVAVLSMAGHRLGLLEARSQAWVELVLSLPVVLWAGWPFFLRGARSVAARSPNMWTLIALGTGAAFAYSVAATVAPGLFPASSRPRSARCCAWRPGLRAASRPTAASKTCRWRRCKWWRPPSVPGRRCSAWPTSSPPISWSPWQSSPCSPSSPGACSARRRAGSLVKRLQGEGRMRQNLLFALLYNGLGIPVAAGVRYPLTGWLLSPMLAALAMSLSSASVVANALRLR